MNIGFIYLFFLDLFFLYKQGHDFLTAVFCAVISA